MRRFVQLIGIYPAGILVRHDTGEVAAVMNAYAPDPYRAHVRVLLDRDYKRIDLPCELNLWETSDDPQRPAAGSIRSIRPTR